MAAGVGDSLGINDMASVWRNGRLPLAVGLTLAFGTVAPATAQFFFRPYYHTWRYELPPEEDDAPRYASRRAIARIMAREGYELVGPLGRRGDQIVATGVSRRAGQARFFIDPYEGEVLHISRLGPPPPAVDERRAPEERVSPRGPMPTEPRTARPAPQPQEKPQRTPAETAKIPPAAEINKVEAPKPAQAVRPAEVAKPQPPQEPVKVEAAKPPEKPAEPPKADIAKSAPAAAPPTEAKAEPLKAEPPKADPPKADPPKAAEPKVEAAAKTESKPTPASVARPTTPNALPQRPVAARSTGGSHRAIVAPKSAEGVTAVPATPAATPPSGASGKTPTGVAMPKDAE